MTTIITYPYTLIKTHVYMTNTRFEHFVLNTGQGCILLSIKTLNSAQAHELRNNES